jgi:hypothetical protein
MRSLKEKLGYMAAALTILIAILTPFLLYGTFTHFFAGLGLYIDESYSGGPKVRTIQRADYSIDIHRPVMPHMLQRQSPFVQIDWRPVSALPRHVSDLVDIDGDGRPDLRVTFDIPSDPKARLHASVESLSPRYQSIQLAHERLSALIVRVDDAILVRVPMVEKP